MILMIGSYTDSLPHVKAKGEGISLLHLANETGEISSIATFRDIRNPTYLAHSHDATMLYAVEELDERDGASVVALGLDKNRALSVVSRLPAQGDCPCHVSLDQKGERLFVSNYVSGNFVTYALDGEGLPTGAVENVRRSGSGPNAERQEGPHAHQATVTPDGEHVLLCDAGTDEIARYGLSAGLVDPQPNAVVKAKGGSLPRHLVFSGDGRHVYVVHELGCTIGVYEYGASGMRLLGEISTLPADFTGQSACAAIRIHPNGRFVYVSNRGHDSIAAFEIAAGDGSLRSLGFYGTRGKTPRDFGIDPTGRYLVAANQDSHSLVTFAIDQTSGALAALGNTYEIGSPVCVLFGKN